MNQQSLPTGWDDARIRNLIAHYDSTTEDDLAAEDNLASDIEQNDCLIEVPKALLPAIRVLVASHREQVVGS